MKKKRSGPPPAFRDEQQMRWDRAERDYPHYTFTPVRRDGRAWYDCHALNSGETYEVTEYDCSCWDHATRAKALGVECKHILMLKIALVKRDLLPAPAVIPQGAAHGG